MRIRLSPGGLQRNQAPRLHIVHIHIFMHIACISAYVIWHSNILDRADWIDKVNSTIICEQKPSSLVPYVLPITHILGKLPWSLLGTREPFHTACAESQPNFPARHVTRSPARVMGADGGMLTRHGVGHDLVITNVWDCQWTCWM